MKVKLIANHIFDYDEIGNISSIHYRFDVFLVDEKLCSIKETQMLPSVWKIYSCPTHFSHLLLGRERTYKQGIVEYIIESYCKIYGLYKPDEIVYFESKS